MPGSSELHTHEAGPGHLRNVCDLPGAMVGNRDAVIYGTDHAPIFMGPSSGDSYEINIP